MLKEIAEHSFYDDKFGSEITIIDLGACRGEFINEMDKFYKVKKGILVEANPVLFNQLPNKENYILYNNAAAKNDDIIVTFYEDPRAAYVGSCVFNYFNGIEHKIKSISLDTLIKTNNIDVVDILKIDVEGSEFEILENISEETLQKINQITVEFHDFIDPKLKVSTKKIISRMEASGYKSISKSTDYMNGSEHYDVLFYKP
jgi:FkbM family methyltransferase